MTTITIKIPELDAEPVKIQESTPEPVVQAQEAIATTPELPEREAPAYKRAYCKGCAKDIYVLDGDPELCVNCNS